MGYQDMFRISDLDPTEHEEAFEMSIPKVASIILRQRFTVGCTPHA
jgi:hypothetical protein